MVHIKYPKIMEETFGPSTWNDLEYFFSNMYLDSKLVLVDIITSVFNITKYIISELLKVYNSITQFALQQHVTPNGTNFKMDQGPYSQKERKRLRACKRHANTTQGLQRISQRWCYFSKDAICNANGII